MIYLIKGAEVYAPHALGHNDILISGQHILNIAPDIHIQGDNVTHIDATNCIVTPGFVDSLVHFCGGGGEGGFHTRTPEMQLTEATLAGVTTVVGALGTDSTTRSHADLIAKARGLENEGISSYCYSGSYQVPLRTVTGSLTDDIILIDKLIGVGEVAIADHRSSVPTTQELCRIASEARVGGMLAGKGGIVSIHVGDSEDKLYLLHQAIKNSNLPASQFYPTHINRNQALLDAGIAWTHLGGRIDFTTSTNQQFIDEGEIPAAAALAYCLKQGVDIGQLTMSSDGNASLPVFNDKGELVGLEVGQVMSLYQSFVQAIKEYEVPLALAVASVSTSPADILNLKNKGRLQSGNDADLLIMHKSNLAIDKVFAMGKLVVDAGKAVVKGTFE
ncbi:MAG: beta-aspartyl-peptidase [Paraglaciecola sp.]|nr:beta-aspartyl-peptidase [Paraglaciecola sp.]